MLTRDKTDEKSEAARLCRPHPSGDDRPIVRHPEAQPAASAEVFLSHCAGVDPHDLDNTPWHLLVTQFEGGHG